MIGPLTYLDAALIAVAFISGLLAMYRGLTRELLSIVSWAAAGGAVLYFVLTQKKFAEDIALQMNTQVPIAQIAIGAIIFLIILIVVHLITARISDAILDSRVGMIDRILGFGFGVMRGFLLIVIPFLLYDWFLLNNHYLGGARGEKPPNIPVWIDNAISRDAIVTTGQAIHAFCVSIYEQYVPALTAPTPAGEQQGQLGTPHLLRMVLENGTVYHISVMETAASNRAV
ncbi:MAG: CvpA family protein [Hyphomicrobium sp.]